MLGKALRVSSQGQNYQIHFTHAAPQPDDLKLYLINLGGYNAREFGELHRYEFVVASNAVVAKQLGKQFIDRQWQKHIQTGSLILMTV